MTAIDSIVQGVTNHKLRAGAKLRVRIDAARGKMDERMVLIEARAAKRIGKVREGIEKREAEIRGIDAKATEAVAAERARFEALKTPEALCLLKLLHDHEVEALKAEAQPNSNKPHGEWPTSTAGAAN